jgi:hypothetical protein
MHVNTKLGIVGLLTAGAIFGLDLLYPMGGAVSILYILLIFISLWTSDAIFTIWAGTITSVLIFIGIWYGGGIETPGSELMIRFFGLIIIWLTAVLSIQRKEVEKELRDLNLHLELKVLARTAAAENRSLRLERQIKILENIKRNQKQEAFVVLDNVIADLRELTVENIEFLDDIDVEYVDDNG